MRERKYLSTVWQEFEDPQEFDSFERILVCLKNMFKAAAQYLRDQAMYPWLQGKYIESAEPSQGWTSILISTPPSTLEPIIRVTVTATPCGTSRVPEKKVMEWPACLLWDFDEFKKRALEMSEREIDRLSRERLAKEKERLERNTKLAKFAKEMSDKGFSQEIISWAVDGIRKATETLDKEAKDGGLD